MAAKPYRLLALVKQDAVVRVQKEPDDTVMTWPHLLSIEFFAAAMISIFLLLMGVFVNAPLEELANGNVTPAVAKAPWYLVGHPGAAGLLPPDRGGRARDPTVILVGAALMPYIDRGPRGDGGSPRPSDRKIGRHALHDLLRRRPGRSPSWAPSSAAPATPGHPCVDRASSSRCRDDDG